MPGPVFTIGCSGTDFDTKACEIITEFRAGIDGVSYKSDTTHCWNMLPLFGAGSIQQYLPEEQVATQQPNANTLSPKQLKFFQHFPRLYDYIGGDSINDNIAKAMQAFKQHEDINLDSEFTVNGFGWSRGASTLIGIANALVAAGYTNVKINLFLIDPLTGPGHDEPELSTIPAAVKHVTVEYAQGEAEFNILRLPLAKPTDLTIVDPETTKVTIIRTPGMHNSAIKHGWGSRDQLEPIAIWDKLHRFLKAHGSQVNTAKMQQNCIEGLHVYAVPYQKPDKYKLLEVWSQLSCDATLKPRGEVKGIPAKAVDDDANPVLLNNPEFHTLLMGTCPALAHAIKTTQVISESAIKEELDTLTNHRCQHTVEYLQKCLPKAVENEPSWLAQQLAKVIDTIKNLPVFATKSDKQPKYLQTFTSRLCLMWARPMELCPPCEKWRNGILSICHDYLSRSFTRHHGELFELLAKVCINKNPLSSVELTLNNYLDRYETTMNPAGLGYNACQFIKNQIKLEKEQLTAKQDAAPIEPVVSLYR